MAATPRHRGAVVAVLGTAQTLAWASSYYLVAMLATPIARDLGIEAPTVFLGFSIALLVSAATGPWAGRAIDRSGGRAVLVGTNLLFALALALLALAPGAATMFAAWALMGVAMGAGLYEAAFATLVRLYGRDSRNAITGITLIAGFASTVGWPLTAWMETQWGWRGACWGWVVLHLAIGVPLNAWLPRPGSATPDRPAGDTGANGATATAAAAPVAPPGRGTGALLALVFATGWFVSTSMAAHLPRVVQAAGAGLAMAVLVGSLVGPAQVAGRLLEFGFLRRLHPLLAARASTLTHPAAVLVLLVGGPALAPAFGILHGLGNGIMTIAMATLPLALFGPEGYGARQGWLMVPARVLQAFAPFLFGLALDRWGTGALALSASASAIGFVALLALSARSASGRDAIGR